MESATKELLDRYYPRFSEYSGNECPRKEKHEERLDVIKKLQAFVKRAHRQMLPLLV